MRLSSAVILSLASGALLAADLPGSRDLETLPRFPHAEIVDFHESAEAEKTYPMGSVRRISGRLRFERQVETLGQLTAVTYRLPAEEASAEAFAAAREALHQRGAELLYWCQGRECGPSNLWANAVFGKASLYGPDDRQAYALLRLTGPQADSLLALYAITRGNRRAYLHVEQLNASTSLGELLPSPATLLRQLRSDGVLALSGLGAEPGEAWSALLAHSLNLDSTLRVSLTGAAAEAWRQALVEHGVRAARLELGESAGEGLRLEILR
jgi:hypothetical protein